jgi:hypothetical protein
MIFQVWLAYHCIHLRDLRDIVRESENRELVLGMLCTDANYVHQPQNHCSGTLASVLSEYLIVRIRKLIACRAVLSCGGLLPQVEPHHDHVRMSRVSRTRSPSINSHCSGGITGDMVMSPPGLQFYKAHCSHSAPPSVLSLVSQSGERFVPISTAHDSVSSVSQSVSSVNKCFYIVPPIWVPSLSIESWIYMSFFFRCRTTPDRSRG